MEAYPKIDALMLGALAFASAALFAVLQDDIEPIAKDMTLALLCFAVTSGVACQLFARHAYFKAIPKYRPFGYASFACGLSIFISLVLMIYPQSAIAALAFMISGTIWFCWLWLEGGPKAINNKPIEPTKK
jgi:hypothetical protein